MSKNKPGTVFKRLNQKKVFIILFLSYMLVLIIPVLIGSVFYNRIVAVISDNADRSNLTILEQLQFDMDKRLQEVNGLCMQVANHPKFDALFNSSSGDPADSYRYIDFRKDLAALKMGSGNILDYYVYFTYEDTIVTPDLKTEPEIFFRGIYRYADMDYETWYKDILHGYHFKYFMPSGTVLTGKGQKNVITFLQSVPLSSRKNILGQIVIMMDEDQIKESIHNIETAGKGSVFILDDHDNVIMSSNGNPEMITGIADDLPNAREVKKIKVGGEDIIVSYIVSPDTGWKYVFMISRDVFMAKVNSIRAMALFMLSLCIVGGMVGAYLMAYKNYSPVRDIVRFIKGERELPGKSLGVEFEFIKQTILSSRVKEKDLNNIILQQAPVIKANFLTRLLKGSIDAVKTDRKSFEFMGIDLQYDFFTVIIVEIEDFSRFSAEESEKEWALVRFALENILGEMVGASADIHFIETDRERIACLLNHRDGSCGFVQVLGSILEEYIATVQSKFHIYITIGASNSKSGADRIGECYSEALKALDYKIIKGQGTLIGYEEIKGTDQFYYYPIEIEMQLVNLVRSGDFANIEAILEDIFNKNFKTKHLSLEMGKCLYSDIISTLIKILGSINIDFRIVFKDGKEPAIRLLECDTVENMRDEVKSIYRELCFYIKSIQGNGSEKLVQNIEKHIRERFTDCSLGLTSISDQFDITPQYLSALFKKQTGENLSDFITRVRVEKAKELLEDGKLSITQIARIVGYADGNVLNRVFKKLEGVTPGSYRKSTFNT